MTDVLHMKLSFEDWNCFLAVLNYKVYRLWRDSREVYGSQWILNRTFLEIPVTPKPPQLLSTHPVRRQRQAQTAHGSIGAPSLLRVATSRPFFPTAGHKNRISMLRSLCLAAMPNSTKSGFPPDGGWVIAFKMGPLLFPWMLGKVLAAEFSRKYQFSRKLAIFRKASASWSPSCFKSKVLTGLVSRPVSPLISPWLEWCLSRSHRQEQCIQDDVAALSHHP
jgi:hypothetical protein